MRVSTGNNDGGDGGGSGGSGGEGHAVVLGAGMSGLLAARALADHFERVTVVERDQLAASGTPRRGVPQGRHAHALLARGTEALDTLLPGLTDELLSAGAVRMTPLAEARYILGGRALARGEVGTRLIMSSRPFLESVIRSRVAALSQVKIIEGCDVTGLTAAEGRVTGARIQRRTDEAAEEVLPASLVVDALGRAGRSLPWLDELGLGHARPAEERLKIDLGYSSRFLRMPPGVFGPDKVVLISAVPGRPTRVVAALLQEGDRWLVTLAGVAGDHPPADDEGFSAFVRSVAPPDVAAALDAAEPLDETAVFRFPDVVRRGYEHLAAPPDGLLAVGDAVCSFNPVYGQGMTVAAMEAEALEQCLRTGGERDLPRRYYRAAAQAVDPAWELAVAADLAVPDVEGHRTPAQRVMRHYTARLRDVGHHDEQVAVAFFRATTLQEPPSSLLAPWVVRRVLRGPRAAERAAAARRLSPRRSRQVPAPARALGRGLEPR